MGTGIELSDIFNYLDDGGSRRRTAEIFLELENTECLTVRAGGPGVLSRPAARPGPYTHYEVLLDHEPARFWRKYGQQDDGVLFASVPRLLIAHHVVRRGGVQRFSWEIKEPLVAAFTLKVMSASDAMLTSTDAADSLWTALESVTDITLAGHHFVAQE